MPDDLDDGLTASSGVAEPLQTYRWEYRWESRDGSDGSLPAAPFHTTGPEEMESGSIKVPITVDVPAYIELLELKDKLKDALALAQRDVREAEIVIRAAQEGHYQWRTKADEWLHRAAPGEGTDA